MPNLNLKRQKIISKEEFSYTRNDDLITITRPGHRLTLVNFILIRFYNKHAKIRKFGYLHALYPFNFTDVLPQIKAYLYSEYL